MAKHLHYFVYITSILIAKLLVATPTPYVGEDAVFNRPTIAVCNSCCRLQYLILCLCNLSRCQLSNPIQSSSVSTLEGQLKYTRGNNNKEEEALKCLYGFSAAFRISSVGQGICERLSPATELLCNLCSLAACLPSMMVMAIIIIIL